MNDPFAEFKALKNFVIKSNCKCLIPKPVLLASKGVRKVANSPNETF